MLASRTGKGTEILYDGTQSQMRDECAMAVMIGDAHNNVSTIPAHVC